MSNDEFQPTDEDFKAAKTVLRALQTLEVYVQVTNYHGKRVQVLSVDPQDGNGMAILAIVANLDMIPDLEATIAVTQPELSEESA